MKAVSTYPTTNYFSLFKPYGGGDANKSLGAELIPDPGFDNPALWNDLGVNWVVGGSHADYDGLLNDAIWALLTGWVLAGTRIRCEFEIGNLGGALGFIGFWSLNFAGTMWIPIAANGVYVREGVLTLDRNDVVMDALCVGAGGCAYDVFNISWRIISEDYE